MSRIAAALRIIVTTTFVFSSFAFSSLSTQAQENIALNKPVTASSSQDHLKTPEMAVDGSSDSRWSSSFADDQWIAIDLGEVRALSGVKLNWQNSYAVEYHIQTSNDGTTWSTVFTEKDSDGGVDTI